MAGEIVLVDSSVLIDYYRKTDKTNSKWIALVRKGYQFAVSTITKYEIYSGATQSQLSFWNNVMQAVQVLPFDEACVDTAVNINVSLKHKRKQIAIADLFIAATAVTHHLPISTINRKHFERIEDLLILD